MTVVVVSASSGKDRNGQRPSQRRNCATGGGAAAAAVERLLSSLELKTIDKYQGRDKACMLVSTVASNAEGALGFLHEDQRRINVLLSRAKHKLIFVGSASTLAGGTSNSPSSNSTSGGGGGGGAIGRNGRHGGDIMARLMRTLHRSDPLNGRTSKVRALPSEALASLQ